MRLTRLQLTNFRLHTDTRIDFDSGLTGVIGPNGSGKTTILEAIAWALYGMTAVRGTRQDIRSLRAPGRAGVRVELEFDLAGHRHHVVRSLSTAELYIDGSSSPIANSTTSVTDLLRRRLGMSQQEFFHTYFTGQKELGIMAAMGPAERAQFLSRVLGYEKLRSAQTLARERRNLIRGELTGLQGAMPSSETIARQLSETEAQVKAAETRTKAAIKRLKKANDAYVELEPRWKEAQKQREQHQHIVAELRVREEEASARSREVNRLTNELTEITAARQEIAEISAELNVHTELAAQLHAMERLFQEEGRRTELNRNRKAVEQELTRLRERLAKSSAKDPSTIVTETERGVEALRDQLNQRSVTRDAGRTEWVRDQQEAKTKREELRIQYDDLRKQRDGLVDLGPDSPCPICTRPLGTHFRQVLDEIDGKLAEIEVNGKYYRNRVDQLEEMPAALRELEAGVEGLEDRLDAQNAALTNARLRLQEHAQIERDVADREARVASLTAEIEKIPAGYHETRHAQLRQQHAQLAPLAERSVRLSALAEREPKVRKELDKTHKDLTRATRQSDTLRSRQADLAFSEQSFTRLQTAFDVAQKEKQEQALAGLAAEKELEAARAARATAEAAARELERAQERLRGLTIDRRLHDELDTAFTDIRADLNQTLRPELSELASGFLAELTDGRYTDLELDEEYNIIVKEDDIPKPVISGGEEDLANLVLRLAISQMIAERAGQSFSLLILDEVFGSLDESRRHNVVELLRRLHDRFEQVILITHIESVREGLDRVLTVRYDEDAGVSRVSQDTSGAILGDETVSSEEYAAAVAGGAG